MAFSADEGKGFFQDWLIHFAKPLGFKTFLDIGAGAGKFGQIIRNVFGREVTVDAVEIFEPYIERHHLSTIYNRIFLTDVMRLGPTYPYDLITIGDTLEHLSYTNAIDVIKGFKGVCRFIWVQLPLKMEWRKWSLGYQQSEDEWKENPAEKHLHEWTFSEVATELTPLWIVPYRITGIFLVEGEIK